MKLFVLIFTLENVSDFKHFPEKHYSWRLIRPTDIPNIYELNKLIRNLKPGVLCVTGNTDTWSLLSDLPENYKSRILYFNSVKEITSEVIETKYIQTILNKGQINKPLFSIITTTFHSGNKILRPYNSLKSQTYKNWEWIIWDDSKEDHNDTWKQLLQFQSEDLRINCFRAPSHSGYIGEMKWRSSTLCKGDWIVELDHDDIIDSRLFQWCIEATTKYPDSDFICSSCVELFEENEKPFSYGDLTAYGYGAYHKEWLRGKWHNVFHVQQKNPKTITHIVGVPNHIRIWKRTFYEKIGKHNPELPVIDDYELLIRTCINGNWLAINAPTYYQFRNIGGNNFTFLRNSLIQYLTAKISIAYKPLLDEYWKSQQIEFNSNQVIKAWKIDNHFTFNKGFNIYTPNITDNTVTIVITVDEEPEDEIIKSVNSVAQQDYTDWKLLIIGGNSSTLNKSMDTITNLFDDSIINKIHWWNLQEKGNRQISLNYAHRMLISTHWISYIEVGKEWDKTFLTERFKTIHNNNLSFIFDTSLNNSIHTFELLTKYNIFSDEIISSLTNST